MSEKNPAVLLVMVSVLLLFSLFSSFTGNVPKGRYCYDSDDGISPYVAGRVVSDIGSFNDRCYDNLHQVREYFCVEGRLGGVYKVESRVVQCENALCERDIVGKMDACVRR